jgi:serine/threonine protein kinase
LIPSDQAAVSESPQAKPIGQEPGGSDSAIGPQPGDVVEARHRYRLEHRLGKGGFGSVFLACRLDGPSSAAEAPPREVAVKVLGPATGEHARTTLKRELGALLSIEHPGIPRLYDWNVDSEPAFAVLEYFPAGSLSDVWPLIGRFDEEQTWRLMSDLLSALGAAHRASILHLDVKPSNVLLDGNGGFVLTDFGVAQAPRMSRGLLQQGHLLIGLGTHGYRAPEQADHSLGSFDLRTDLWGVGATAWALYTGIDLNKRQDVLRHKEPGNIYGLQRLSDVRIHCPPPLEEVVMGLLFIDPARRPGGASEVLSRIQAIADGFGLDSQTVAAARRDRADPEEVRVLVESLVDPLWSSICRSPAFHRYFVKFADGEEISRSGFQTHHTYLLLRGEVEVVRDEEIVATESREGTFLCAVSTFTGVPRQVTLRARGEVWVCIFNEAELEQLVTCNPAVAVRMIRNLTNRIAKGPPRDDA